MLQLMIFAALLSYERPCSVVAHAEEASALAHIREALDA